MKVKAGQIGLAQAVFHIPESRVYLLQGLNEICLKDTSTGIFVCEETMYFQVRT